MCSTYKPFFLPLHRIYDLHFSTFYNNILGLKYFPQLFTHYCNKCKLRIQLSIGQSLIGLFMAEVNTSANIRLSACMLPKHHQLMPPPEVEASYNDWFGPLAPNQSQFQFIHLSRTSAKKCYLRINTGSSSLFSKEQRGADRHVTEYISIAAAVAAVSWKLCCWIFVFCLCTVLRCKSGGGETALLSNRTEKRVPHKSDE